MPTLNQKRVAEQTKLAIEHGERINAGAILENIGYSKAIAKNPKLIFGSKGFKEAMKELGFSLAAADLTVAKILQTGREENQLKASDQIYKRLGGYVESPTNNTVILVNVSEEIAKKNNINAVDPSAITNRE
jgi:RNA-binding protein YhbY